MLDLDGPRVSHQTVQQHGLQHLPRDMFAELTIRQKLGLHLGFEDMFVTTLQAYGDT